MTTTVVRTWKVTPALLRADLYEREVLSDYLATGGYPRGLAPADLLDRIDGTGLRGRGGAGFPLATKLRAVRDRPGRPIVVANGEEGEPGSVKDRHLMRTRPHLILDGLAHAAAIVGADRGYVYVSDPPSAASIRAALAEKPQPVTVVEVEPAYVAGEETAVVRFIDGGPALPVAKPPRPFESGVGGAPTLVSNVETLAHVALLAAGVDATDHLLLSLAPDGVLLETSTATTFGELGIATALIGGMFGGLATFDGAVRLADAPIGNGTLYLLAPGECPVDVAADALAYLGAESSRQCGVCVSGTRSLADAVAALRDATASEIQVANVARWAGGLPGRGACGLLDAAARVAGSLVANFAPLIDQHVIGRCSTCAASSRRHGWRFTVYPPRRAA
ncbi:MAG TPA: NADH-ubiquinone oxidoreductase-F iron-sulfur binding region domain-containing protein [Micromonosporaceae bacterium]